MTNFIYAHQNTLQLAKCCEKLDRSKKQEKRKWLQLTLERTASGEDVDDAANRAEAERMLTRSDEICINGSTPFLHHYFYWLGSCNLLICMRIYLGPECKFLGTHSTCDHHHSNSIEKTGANFDPASVIAA